MATQTKIVGTCISETGIGTQSWATPGNATADDASWATTGNKKDTIMNRLKGTMSGNVFTIPAGSTIDGIVVGVMMKVGTPSSWADYEVKLVKGGTAGTGDDKARSPTTFWPTSEAEILYGAVDDLWGLTLDVADVNSAGFGASISARENYGIRNVGSVDYIKILVSYTEAAGDKEADGSATGTGTTGHSLTKSTSVDGADAATGTTGHSLTKTTSVSGADAATGTTDHTLTVTKNASGADTATGTTGHSFTKTTAASGADTATGTTGHTLTKTASVSGSATATGTTGHSAEKGGAAKNADGSATATGTTGHTLTKTAVLTKGDAGAGATGYALTKTTVVAGSATASGATGYTVTRERPATGSATATGTTGSTLTKIAAALGIDTATGTTGYTLVKTTAVSGSATATGTTGNTVTKQAGTGHIAVSLSAAIYRGKSGAPGIEGTGGGPAPIQKDDEKQVEME